MAERQTTVGAFVLGGALLGVTAIALFGKFHPFSPTSQAVVVFDGPVNGLGVGAPVTFNGVQVGHVERIAVQFDPATHQAYIPVTLELEANRAHMAGDHGKDLDAKELPRLVENGLRAELHMQSFVTGQEEIDLTFDPACPRACIPA